MKELVARCTRILCYEIWRKNYIVSKFRLPHFNLKESIAPITYSVLSTETQSAALSMHSAGSPGPQTSSNGHLWVTL